MSVLRSLIHLFLVSVAVNYPWELAQSPLYEWPGESRNEWWHCFVASLGDGVLVLTIFGAGWLAFGRANWFSRPGLRGYFLMLLSGLLIAAVVEWIAIEQLHRWTYAHQMPLIPGLEVGVVPIAQMLLLPPVIFRLASAALRARPGMKPR